MIQPPLHIDNQEASLNIDFIILTDICLDFIKGKRSLKGNFQDVGGNKKGDISLHTFNILQTFC